MSNHLPKYLTALMLSALMLMGCARDEVVDEAVVESIADEGGNTLMLRLTMAAPAGQGVVTGNPTGGENGDGLRLGRYNENSIYNVYLYKYSSPDGINASDDTPVTLLANQKNINFHPQASDVDANGLITKDVLFNVGDYSYKTGNHDHFIAAVNTEPFGTNTTLGELRNGRVAHTCQQTGTQAKDFDRFTMANAHDSRYKGGAGSKTDPYLVDIDVERTAARIDFAYSSAAMTAGDFRIEGGKYIYKVEGASGDEVQLTHVRATNVMGGTPYLIKRLATGEGVTPDYLADETNPASQYVVEPTTWSKTLQAVEADQLPCEEWFRDSWYMNAVDNFNSATNPWFRPSDRVHSGGGDAFTDGTTLDEQDHDWHYYVVDYANENTMQAEHTLHHYTTGLILKATYAPAKVFKAVDGETGKPVQDEDYVAGQTFWRWHDVDTNKDLFFSNESAAEDYKALHPHSLVFPYADGQCYYNVWLRHENIIDDPTTTMMEFGIVRNNIYRVCVEFTGVGMPNIPDDMITPENIRMYIFVRKWNLIEHPAIEL